MLNPPNINNNENKGIVTINKYITDTNELSILPIIIFLADIGAHINKSNVLLVFSLLMLLDVNAGETKQIIKYIKTIKLINIPFIAFKLIILFPLFIDSKKINEKNDKTKPYNVIIPVNFQLLVLLVTSLFNIGLIIFIIPRKFHK